MQMSAQLMHDRTQALGDNRIVRMSANILYASDQMLSFVKEFLANTAADRGFPFRLEPMSLAREATATIQRYAEAARRKSLTLHEKFSPDLPLVMADRTALDQVLDNLMSNAVKFSQPETAIWLTISRPEAGWVECRVRDEGPGCTADDLANMFLRYRRLSARPTAGEPSTGLGLSIARRHVEAMEGKLYCESEFGHGATFVLRLPVAL